MFAPKQNTVRLESNGILMTYIYNILILTPKGLTPDYAAGNQHRAFSRYHCSSQSSYFFEGTWKSSQTMQVITRGEVRGRFLINAV